LSRWRAFFRVERVTLAKERAWRLHSSRKPGKVKQTAMKRIEYGNWIIEVDAEATRDVFRQIPQGGPEECGCAYCRNFIVCRENVYPQAFRDFLEMVGSDYRKESEVYQFCKLPDGRHDYGGCFHFIGEVSKIVKEEDEPLISTPDFECRIWNGRSLAHRFFEGKPLVEVNFESKLPWQLAEDEPAE
jgi:hypothetical protein